jgi:hypothetical protein
MINNNFENAINEMTKKTQNSSMDANTYAILSLVEEMNQIKESFQSIISSYEKGNHYLKVNQ